MFFIKLLVFIGLIHYSFQQTCELYNPQDLTFPCSLVTSTNYAYIPVGFDLSTVIYITNSITEGLKGQAYSEVCSPILVTWFCREKLQIGSDYAPLQNCAINGSGLPIDPPLIVPPCKSMCDKFKTACLPFYERSSIGFLFDNYCEQFTDNRTDVKCWSTEGIIYAPTYGNLTCPLGTAPMCFNGNLNETDHRNIGKCGNTSNTCGAQCPSPEFTEDQFNTYGITVQVCAWLSFVFVLCLLPFYIFNPTLNLFPLRIVIYLFISTIPLSIAFILITFSGGNVGDLLCGDTIAFGPETIQGDESVNSNIRAINNQGFCAAQGFFIVFGTLSVTAWWAILAYNTFGLVRMAQQFKQVADHKNPFLEPIYLVIGFVIPLILSIIVTASIKVDYEVGYLYCFISSSHDQAWRIACWFVWMGIYLLVGTVCLLACAISLVANIGKQGVDKTKLIRLIRILVCLVFVFSFVVTVFTSLITNAAVLSNTRVQVEQLVICILGGTPYNTCIDALHENSILGDQYNLDFASAVYMSLVGFIMVLIFGTNARVYTSCRETKQKITSLTKHRSSVSASSSSNSVSGNGSESGAIEMK